MTSRTLRILLLLTAFGALVAGSFVVFSAERNLALASTASAGFDAQARAVRRRNLAPERRAAGLCRRRPGLCLLDDAGGRAPRLGGPRYRRTGQCLVERGHAFGRPGGGASLEQFRALDKRARQYVQNNQILMASDVIFTESLGALTTAAEHVGTAAENELAIRAAESDGLRGRQLYAAAGAAGVLLLVVLLLVPVPESDVDVLTAMRALTESAPLRPHAIAMPAKPRTEIAVGRRGLECPADCASRR